MTSVSTWKILVVIHHIELEIMKEMTKSIRTWLDQALFTLIYIKINVSV